MPRLLAICVALLLALLAWVSPRTASATGDPDVEWFTIETEHFVLHYHEGLEHMARESAHMCEEAHDLLSPMLDWTPGQKTHVVLSDFGDSANGSASVVPYNLVRLLGATPDIRGSLYDYDDWLRSLIYHEYVHILHIDTMYGIADWINVVFGKTVAPNGSLPRWYTEGLATYYESARSEGGRVRNSIFRMTIRTQALQDEIFPVDLIGGSPTRPPGLRAWYMHGAHFLAWLAGRYGEGSLTEYNHRYGARIIPYGLNIVAREVFGVDLVTLYDQWVAAETGAALAHWVGVRAAGGPTPIETLPEIPYDHDHLRPRPNHDQLSFVHSDGYSRRNLVLVDEDSGELETLRQSFGPGRMAWLPDGSAFVVAEVNNVDRYYSYQDLFRYEMDTGELTRLTVGMRAREPDVSPDGRRVVFSAQREGTSDLMVLDLDTLETELLDAGDRREHHSTPRWLPDGERLVVSRFWEDPVDATGQRDLFLFDTRSGRYTQLTDDRAVDLEPDVDPTGRWIVFSSDRTGTWDLYLHDLETGEQWRVTHASTGLFAPSFSSDGRALYATWWTALGQTVGRIDLEAIRTRGLEPAPVDTRTSEPIRPALAADDLEVGEYRPWRWLFPRSWLPEFILNVDFENVLNLALSGSDPVGNHAWSARFGYSTESEQFSGSLSYLYRRLPVDLQLRLSRGVVRRSFTASNRDQFFDEEQVVAGLDVVAPFPGVNISHNLSATFQVVRYALADALEIDHDPLGTSPRYPELGFFNLLRLSWSVFDVESYNYSVSTELGYILSAAATLRGPYLGADVNSFDLTWSATGYLPMPWLWGHVLAARYAGGIGWADYNRRGLFIIGGLPDVSLLDSVLQGLGVGAAYLRGYPLLATFGDQYHLANFEYRFPLYDIEEGLWTLPGFIDQLSGALFADYGAAFFDEFDFDKLKLGIGGELRLRILLGYQLPYLFRLGYAFGVHEPGLHHIYGVIGSQF